MLRMIETVIDCRAGAAAGAATGSGRVRSLSVTRWEGTGLVSPA